MFVSLCFLWVFLCITIFSFFGLSFNPTTFVTLNLLLVLLFLCFFQTSAPHPIFPVHCLPHRILQCLGLEGTLKTIQLEPTCTGAPGPCWEPHVWAGASSALGVTEAVPVSPALGHGGCLAPLRVTICTAPHSTGLPCGHGPCPWLPKELRPHAWS